MPTTYHLQVPTTGRHPAPVLDAAQRAVVDHPGGPLLVLAGPGTGKTTTLVETVVDRVDDRGLAADQVLVLTFSRKAAQELRSRIGARLRDTATSPTATTFHSFCYALVRRFQDPEAFTHPLQLLSAAEQDARIRELVAGTLQTHTVQWPPVLRPALGTHGLAVELQAVISRARALGMDPAHLRALAESAQRPDWRAAAEFFEDYLDVFDAQNLIDYGELVHRALIAASYPAHQRQLHAEFSLVVVDEYQDTDPTQVALLAALAGGGRDLVAVGDPDQSIYAFRGADVGGVMRFTDDFRTAAGAPAPVLALRSTRRFGRAILAASRAVIGPLGVTGGLDRETFHRFRHPESVDPVFGDGEVVVQTFGSAAAEAEHIALMLRRAHLKEGVPWSQMAVLVRSATASLPRLQRALVDAGIPVEVAGDELPLRSAPAVAQLLQTLRVAQDLAESGEVAPASAEALLTGPIGALDASVVRSLTRVLRRIDAEIDPETNRPTQHARPSATLLAETLAKPEQLVLVDRGRAARTADRVRHVAGLLARAKQQILDRAPAEQILWDLWDGSGWPHRLSRAVERGGGAARTADRDLDAVCALFDLAARAEERGGRRTLAAFLAEVDAQQIPAETLAERGVRDDAVRLLTAHRSKGLQWRVVVVAGVQDGVWPDVRHRGSLLQPDRMSPRGPQPPASTAALLAEERRLFYVAVTRARQRLVVTAVQSPAEDGEQPSRFLTAIRPFATTPERDPLPMGRPPRPLSLRGVVAELRGLAEQTDDADLRAAALQRLGALAVTGDDGVRVGAADPDRWWGVHAVTANAVPVRPPDEPLALSGSSLNGLVSCPLSWFLSHEAKGDTASTSAQGFGLVIHALAADVVRGGTSDDPAELMSRLDTIWPQLSFAAPWVSVRERAEAQKAIGRFVTWHRSRTARTLAAEHRFEVTVPIGGDAVVLRGSMDRVEVEADDLVRVVDYKTGKNPPKATTLSTHPQLGVYQLAVEHGGVPDVPGARSGGAELVHLRLDDSAKTPGVPKVQPQSPPASGEELAAFAQLEQAVRVLRDERFDATPGPEVCGYCDFKAVCPAQPEGRTILPVPQTRRDRPMTARQEERR